LPWQRDNQLKLSDNKPCSLIVAVTETKMISLPKPQLIRAVAQTVARGNPESVSAPASITLLKGAQPVFQSPPEKLTSYSLSKEVQFLGTPRASNSIAGSSQVRFAHTDFARVPDFNHCRIKEKTNPVGNDKEVNVARRTTSYILTGASAVGAAYSAKYLVRMFLGHFQPANDVLALSKVEIKLDAIPEGRAMTFKWRGKPLFIRHRTDEEVAREDAVDIATLRDPQHNKDRAKNPKFLIVLGVCTHLGCVPIADAGDYAGGYYCPCHGSHYDGAGRIRKGPAPLNLEVPYYEFTDDGSVVVGQ